MDSFKELLNHYIIAEAISLKNAKKKMLSKKYSGAYNDRLDEIFKGKNRIFRNLKIDYSNIDSPLKRKIENFLIQKKYQIDSMEDYIKGIAYKYKIVDEISFATEVDRKNPLKIGKLLQKFEEDGEIEVTHRVDGKKTTKTVTGKPLLHEFKNDPIRSSNGDFVIVISRHPYDIAGASTDRSWTSCMDLGLPRINYPKTKQNEGINRKYISKDIEEGTLVAYVVTKDEMYIGPNGEPKVKLQKPLSRILIKPHNSDVGKVYTVGTRYGAQYPEFYQKIKEWVSKTLNDKLRGGEKIYKNPKLYNDGDTPIDFEFNTGNAVADEVMTDLLNHNNEKQVGNQITFETTNNGHVTTIEMKIVLDFGKDIVRSFDYLDNIYSVDNRIKSEYEKRIGTAIFQNLRGRGGRGFNDGSPRVTVTSLGDGIEIEVECDIQVSDEEDKYIDDDVIWNNTYYPMEWLKNFDYKQLKHELYKICSTYDWKAHDEAVITSINEALGMYKNVLDTFPKFYPKGNISFQSLEVISPSRILAWEESAIKVLYNDLYATTKSFETLYTHMSMFESKQNYSFGRDDRYTNTKFEIFYEWFKRTFNVDLVNYKDNTEEIWKITKVFDLVRDLRTSDNPQDREKSELLLDIREEQGKIIGYIRRFIGYMGEVKI